jgi:hypothetical protein
MSKTRSDSKLAPHEDFIFERLVDGNEGYQTVADALQKELGVQTSATALSLYFAKHSWRWRAERAAARADAIKKALLKDPQNFDQAKAAAIANREFELAASNLSVQELARLKKIGQIDRKLNLEERSIELREFDAAKAALQHAAAIKSIAASKSLNDTEKIDAVRRRLFGDIPEEVDG